MGRYQGSAGVCSGRTFAYKFIAVIVSAVMAVSLCPISGAYAEPAQDQEEESYWYDNIDQMLEGKDYVDGEAIAVVAANGGAAVASLSEDDSEASGSSDLLAGAEELFEASASSASLVLDADLGGEAQALALDGDEDGANEAEEPGVQIVLVKKDGVSTRDLLQQLAEDPQVVSAEPNYIVQLADVDSADGATGNEDGDGNSSDNAANANEASGEKGTANGGSADEGSTGNGTGSSGSASGSGESADGGSDQGSDGSSGFVPSKATQIDPDKIPDLTGYQWGNNGGDSNVLTGSKASGNDVQVPDWNTNKENSAGIVCLMDTGVDYNHPDLKNSMVELPDSVVSTIGGGKHGINCYAPDKDPASPMDKDGHGTHVAGIVAAQWNGTGTSGAANGAKLMAVKIGSESGITLEGALRGYAYVSRALDAGVDIRVVNNSWGADGSVVALNLAMTEVGQKGAISVCASGNDAKDIDSNTYTPTGTSTSPYTVIVNSSSANGEPSLFSDWGKETTNLYTPGAMIMSTICQSKSVYMPWLATDIGNAAYDTFDGSGSIEAYVGYGSAAVEEQNRIALGSNDCHFDSAGSLAITGAQLKSADQGEMGAFKHRYAVTLKIPVAKSDLDKVAYLGYSCSAEKTDFSTGLYYEAIDGSGKKDMVRNQRGRARAYSNIGWESASIDLADSLGWANCKELVWHPDNDQAAGEDSGYLLMSVTFETQGDEPSDDEKVYLDCVGLGSTLTPYSLMNGTSMASPLAAAGAAICSTEVDQTKPASERALELVSLLQSCTTERSQFEGKCTSNGMLDLSKLGNTSEYQPVMSSATLEEGEDANYVVVEGSYLGEAEGKVTIGGYAAQVVSWGSSSVKVKSPDEVTSGKREVVLTTASGKSCRLTTVLRFTENPPEGDVPLFEESISLDGLDFASQVKSVQMIGLDGYIYAFPQIKPMNKDFGCDLPFKSFYRYCVETGTWEDMGNLPASASNAKLTAYGTLSLALWEGKILMLTRGCDDSLKEQYLFSYDPGTNEWDELDQIAAKIPIGASIVNAGGTIVAIGGSFDAPDEETNIQSNNIASVDMETGETKVLGSLCAPRSNVSHLYGELMQVVASGSTIYVAGGVSMNKALVASNNLPSERLVKQADGTYKAEDLTKVLPETQFYYDYSAGLAAGTDGAAFSALKVTEGDEDTYLVGNSSAEATPFGKKASDVPLAYATSLAYHGKLYTVGLDEFHGGSAVMRATVFSTPEHPAGENSQPDPGPAPEPAPDPDPTPEVEPASGAAADSGTDGDGKSASAKTADESRSAATAVFAAAMGALATAAFAARRRRAGE